MIYIAIAIYLLAGLITSMLFHYMVLASSLLAEVLGDVDKSDIFQVVEEHRGLYAWVVFFFWPVLFLAVWKRI